MKREFKPKFSRNRWWIRLAFCATYMLGLHEARAQEIFLRSDWLISIGATNSALASTAAAIWSGGNDAPSVSGVITNWVTGYNTNPAGAFTNDPVAVTGFNQDVVVENTATGGNTAPYITAIFENEFAQSSYAFNFFEAGLTSVNYTGGNPTVEGLPTNGIIQSIFDGTTVFKLQPYDGNNVLFLNYDSPTGALSMAGTSAYNSLAVLACSAIGGGYGTLTIQFADGTSSSPINFNASDWEQYDNPGVAFDYFGSIYDGYYSGFYTDNNGDGNPFLYQTTLNLVALGLNTKPISSLIFTMPNGSGTTTNTVTGIFAISGSTNMLITTPVVTAYTNSICLAESAIGQITPQSAGSVYAVQDLQGEVAANLAAGNAYQSQNGVSAPAVAWYNTLAFPGGFDPLTGSNYPSGVTSTYNISDIQQADYDLRALLEVNPGDTNSAQQLVLLAEDQMLPLEWSGAEAMTYATYARLNGLTQNGTNRETLCVEEARGYYQNACNVFGQFLSNPFNADLVEGQNPLISSTVTNQVAEVLDDYLRDVNGYAQASLTDFQLRQLASFYDPTVSGSVPPQALLSDIDNTVNQIQMWLMLASPFQNDLAAVGAAYTTSQAGQINGLLHDMRRLHKSILLGRITFETGASGETESGDSSLNYSEFTTSFVPFFNGLPNPGNSSFDVALNLAESFTGYAATEEAAASSDIQNVQQGAYTWASDQNSLQNQYLTELENLCGYFYDTNGNPNPDIFFAALPPGLREQTANQILPPGSYQIANTGTIYQQWLTLESAETNLLLAEIQLSNTVATMVSDTQVADAIYSNQVEYAALILTNGDQISGIDQQEGQVQASADQQIEQINATTAQEQANNSFWGDIGSGILSGIASAASAFATGGATAAEGQGASGGTQIINAFTTQANGYDQASSDLQIGSVEANEATQLADLNAQISQINASEQAQEQYVNADTTMLNLSANLSALRLQANSQEVEIQLAAQQVDEAKSQLATMLAQAGSLINQWTRSASLINQNPAFSSDLLVIQDTTIQQANDAFALAQEWAFLAALSLNYLDNCPNAQNFVPSVLAARRTGDLTPIFHNMETEEAAITSEGGGCQQSPLYSTVQFSLRNNYVQDNQTTVSGSNTVVTSYEPVLQGGIVSSSATASEAAWSNYLASCVITNKFGERVLLLNFATSLDNQIVAETQFNPLFTCETFGGTLYSGQDNNGNQMRGVQVSLSTQGFNPPLGASSGFEVVLSQLGTSVIRDRGFGNQTQPTPGFRYFNFGNFEVGITASENNLTGNGGTGTFEGRSPANSQWQLSINAADSQNNEALINNLGDLTDLQLQFSIQSYVDQIAVENCNSP